MKILVHKHDNHYEQVEGNRAKGIEIRLKDGKSIFKTEFVAVKLFGEDYVATKGKDGHPILSKASEVSLVDGYTYTRKGKDGKSYTAFADKNSVILCD